MRYLRLKLSKGDDLKLAIARAGVEIKASGFVLGIVGNLSKATFQCPGRNNSTIIKGLLEIISLQGTFSEDSVHLHISISDGEGKVHGGHLEKETIIQKDADILLGILDDKSQVYSKFVSNNNFKSKIRLEIAVLPDCPWSAKAVQILQEKEVPHFIRTISNDEQFRLFQIRSESSIFPQIFVDGKFIGGFKELARFLESADWPKNLM